MAITKKDVKLLKSQRLSDTDDGGGRATGEAVTDNKINDVFPNISRLDRTIGHVNVRKLFAGVQTETNDGYLGAHAIIAESPADPLVDTLLFNTGSQTDERKDAQSVIEGYVVPSVIADFDLMGDQFKGQRQLSAVAFETRPVPEVGDVFQLVTDTAEQFVRLTEVEHEMREFHYVDDSGKLLTFWRRYLRLSISSALLYKFPGGQVVPEGVTERNLDGEKITRVRATQVADSARYFGVNKLAQSVSAGSLTLQVESIYSQLVPSTIKENILVDQIAGSRKRYNVATANSDRTINLTFTSSASGQSRSFIGTGVYRGSLVLTVSGSVYRDNGAGELKLSSGGANFDRITIDYESGMLTAFRPSAYTGSASVTYRTGVAATNQSVTGEIEIKLGNRGYAYTLNLSEAKPRPATLTISFMALGRWYQLRDEGDGQLIGEGAGAVDFATGSVALTLDALPDVGSSIIYDYVAQDDFNFAVHTGASLDSPIKIVQELKNKGLDPASIKVTTKHGGVTKTMTSNEHGQITGEVGTGFINAADGILNLVITQTLDLGSAIDVQYEFGTNVSTNLTLGADGGGMTIGTIPGAPFKPGSISFTWDVKRKGKVPVFNRAGDRGLDATASLDVYDTEALVTRNVTDDGNGKWRGVDGQINYQTGEFSIRTETTYTVNEYYINYRRSNKPELAHTQSTERERFTGTIIVKAQEASVSYGGERESIPAPQLVVDLLPNVGDSIVPGSLLLKWGSSLYVDRDGVLYKDIDHTTNAGTAVGRVDYAGRQITLASWPSNVSTKVERLSCLTTAVGFGTQRVFFRTAGSPLRPASLQITAVRIDTGEVVTATPNLNGDVSSGIIHGHVDARTGIARLQFTTDPDDDSGLSDVPVIAALLRYNAVLQTSMPMDAKLLGLNPVRLPADGRVPIYREGDVLVIHHTQATAVEPAAGKTITLNRAEQAEIYVVDAEGNRLDEEQYETEREEGTLTFANPLLLQQEDGELLVPPFKIMDRIEHMTVCTEAQITGLVEINSPLSFDAPAGETMVSSALTWGDMQSRLYRWFTQKTWSTGNPNWSDNPVGDQTTANYNTLNYPPIVTNTGAIAGKWALVFTSTTAFQVVEEKLGIITVGNVSQDCSPINPATNTPYFVIKKEGWGTGWASGNAVRFNTDSCLGPMWVVRSIQAGKGAVKDDHFKLQVRGDAD
ncbi:hypothetical protein HX099_10525 [Thiopseudomonas alkaliphila]|uniref:Tail protein n=1 Tax=Thiopseudomonas alkaliphila TaxID=1697053 RepID=A0AAW7DWP3_9GAMM|nr:hypothetical protein [Thiopseudomonas alkaliphila]MDM1697088.1 hypothetical protein [Thiopseudomonas alkaliphila]